MNYLQASENDKRWSSERSDLLRDQAGLQKLHDNLQQDYEGLLKERDNQKEVERQLRADLRKLQVNYGMFLSLFSLSRALFVFALFLFFLPLFRLCLFLSVSLAVFFFLSFLLLS